MVSYLIDTNVLLRFLLGDVKDQAEVAKDLFIKARRGEATITIPLLVYVETVFALIKLYRFPKNKVIEILTDIIDLPFIQIENRDLMREALIYYRDSPVGFVDALVAVQAKQKGMTLITFDKKLKKLSKKISN